VRGSGFGAVFYSVGQLSIFRISEGKQTSLLLVTWNCFPFLNELRVMHMTVLGIRWSVGRFFMPGLVRLSSHAGSRRLLIPLYVCERCYLCVDGQVCIRQCCLRIERSLILSLC